MTLSAISRLQRLLGGPGLASVRQRLRQHFERAEADHSPAIIRLTRLTNIEHTALCQLTGRPSHAARSMTLDITSLDEQLRAADLAGSLRDALEQLDGPIIAKARLRQTLREQWSTQIANARISGRLRAWLDEAPGAPPLLKRLGRTPDGGLRLLSQADAVLARLPAPGQPRSQLAADVLGDAHALDTGRPVASIVLSAWRHQERNRPADPDYVDTGCADNDQNTATNAHNPEIAEERQRDTWARAGILVNELARPALLLNLPVAAPAQVLWKPGEPTYLSLRQLLRTPPAWAVAGKPVFVCENPNLLAIAADQLGARCAPLVCTDGMPAAAQRALLDQLQKAGACLRYHGDFDWPGIRIANFVIRTWQAIPWRLTADDYERAAQAAIRSKPGDLGPPDVAATWDTLLAPALRDRGIPIAEEAVATSLLNDLRDG